MSAYEYPRLSRSDILTVLAETQIANLTENDLKNLNSEFVSDVYTRLLIYVDVLSEEDNGQVDFAALEQFENPDLHVGAVQGMNLQNKVKELLSYVDCPLKFTLKDLLRPDVGRTEFFISAILNFALHKDSKLELMQPIAEELSLLDERRRDLDSNISQLNAEIAEVSEARERELPLVHEVEREVNELRQKIANLNSQQLSLHASHRKLKEKAADMNKEISKAEFELVQSIQENANLRSKIVQSPEKLQRALEEKKLVLEEAKNAERLARQMFQDKGSIIDVYTQALKKLSKHSAQMQAINEQVNSAKSIEKDYKVLKAKLSDDVVLDKSLDAKLVDRRWKAEQLHELLKQLEKERDLKIEEARKGLNEVRMEVESRRRDLEERQKRVESIVAEVDAITAKIEMVKQWKEAKAQQLASKCDEIVKELQQYTNSIGTLIPDDGSGPNNE